MNEPQPTFLSLYHTGAAKAADIDDFIDAWHALPGPFGPKLHTYLGLTWDEYKRWGAMNELPGP